jgi:hypothetical protein
MPAAIETGPYFPLNLPASLSSAFEREIDIANSSAVLAASHGNHDPNGVGPEIRQRSGCNVTVGTRDRSED